MGDENGVDALARKLARALETAGTDEPYVFTRDEVRTLQAVIAFVERLRALRWFSKWAMYLVVAGGTILINWDRLRDWWMR